MNYFALIVQNWIIEVLRQSKMYSTAHEQIEHTVNSEALSLKFSILHRTNVWCMFTLRLSPLHVTTNKSVSSCCSRLTDLHWHIHRTMYMANPLAGPVRALSVPPPTSSSPIPPPPPRYRKLNIYGILWEAVLNTLQCDFPAFSKHFRIKIKR